jgi:hypothetical protein
MTELVSLGDVGVDHGRPLGPDEIRPLHLGGGSA